MKNRIFLMMIAALLIVFITACGSKTEPVSTADTADAATGDAAEKTEAKPMVGRTQTTPSSNVEEGFIIFPADVHVRPGETVWIDIRLENPANRKAERFEVRVDNENLPIKGATIKMSDTYCYAVSGIKEYYAIGDTWYCDTLLEGEPQEIDTDEPVCQFDLKIPADAKPGVYTWEPDRFHVVENSNDGVEFDAAIKPGKIIVDGDGSTPSSEVDESTPLSEVDETTPSSEVVECFIIFPADVHVRPGEIVEIDIRLENPANRKAERFEVRVNNENLPIKGATIKMLDTYCYAVSGIKEYYAIGDTWYCDTLLEGEPQEIDTDEPVCQFDLKIPADAKPGVYTWEPDRFHVVENSNDGVEFDAEIKPGKIIVEADD